MDNERYEFLSDRIDHADSRTDDLDVRITALESAKEVKKAHTMEWIVIVLILIEIVEGCVIYLLTRHG